MKKGIRIRSIIVLLSILTLAGCGSQEAPPDFAQVYVRGILDTLYLGEYSGDFLSVTDTQDPAALEAEYLAGLETEVNYFAYYFGIGELTEPAKEDLTELYRELYQLSRYEVQPSILENGSYIVNVIVEPLDAIDRVVKEDLDTFAAELKAASANTMTSGEYEEHYIEGLIGLIREKMETPGYYESVTLTLEVVQSPEDELYYIKGNGLAEIDEQIIQY